MFCQLQRLTGPQDNTALEGFRALLVPAQARSWRFAGLPAVVAVVLHETLKPNTPDCLPLVLIL